MSTVPRVSALGLSTAGTSSNLFSYVLRCGNWAQPTNVTVWVLHRKWVMNVRSAQEEREKLLLESLFVLRASQELL